MLWEPPGQRAGGEARPVGTWHWGVWGGTLLGRQETLVGAGTRGWLEPRAVTGCRREPRVGREVRKWKNRVDELRRPPGRKPCLPDLEVGVRGVGAGLRDLEDKLDRKSVV